MLTRTWMLVAAICLLYYCITLEAIYEADEILSLPGQPAVNFRQFSGYINVGEKQQRSMFYYFLEAEVEPSSKPLVLWLAGGPICSSIGLGAFGGNGPFRPNGNILVRNEFSWNSIGANMLYLDSPAGVGFSYSEDKSFYTTVTDDITAQDNLVFLQKWFDRFSEYKGRDFFISGETYAGHFVPQLAQLVVQSKMKCKLKGILLQNPVLDLDYELNSRAKFLWSHGMISDTTFEILTNVCNSSEIFRQGRANAITTKCSQVKSQVASELSRYVKLNAITSNICLPPVASPPYNHVRGGKMSSGCLRDDIINFLNRKDVQNALHVRLTGVSDWTICSEVVHPRFQEYETRTIDMLGSLIKSGIRTMVYSGDQDAIVPLTATRKLVDELATKMNINTTMPYRAWFESGQVGGWTQVYGDMILSYATVRGASSNAALTQPQRSLVIFGSFLNGKPLPDKATTSA